MSVTTEITIAQGRIRGTIEDGLAVFRGVPFAAPPVGTLRFKPPSPVAPWRDVLDVTSPAAICPQPRSRLAALMGDFHVRQDENCLTVNIWAPTPLGRRRPLLVWIHGGACVSGGGALPWYDGARLARDNDVIVVNVNYRLGALGYLFRPGLAAGNMGVFDLVQALRWIHENAAAFGGDPGQITLMGQSAGGNHIFCLLALPETRALVRRVVLLSTGFGTATEEDLTASSNLLCEQLGIDPGCSDALERLQSVPVEHILEAQIAASQRLQRSAGNMMPPFALLSVGGLPSGWDESAFATAAASVARGMEIIIGTTAEEAKPFYTLDPRLKEIGPERLPALAPNLLGPDWSDRIARARRLRPGATASETLCDAQSAKMFMDPAERFAAAVAQGGGKVWAYRFDWRAPNSDFGACHCIELPFVFGTFDACDNAPMLGAVTAKMQALSGIVRGALGRFVLNGSPNGDSLPHWPQFTSSSRALLTFDETIRVGCGNMDSHRA